MRSYIVTTEWATPPDGGRARMVRLHKRKARTAAEAMAAERAHNNRRLAEGMAAEGWRYAVVGVSC